MRVFICFDGRARGGDIDEADVLEVAHSEEEARASDWRGTDHVWFEYEDDGSGDLVNPRERPELSGGP